MQSTFQTELIVRSATHKTPQKFKCTEGFVTQWMRVKAEMQKVKIYRQITDKMNQVSDK